MSFERCFDFVVDALEGGEKIVREPDGSLTKWGVCSRYYPELDVAALTRDEARDIYRVDYWDVAGCDRMAWPLNLMAFDCAVNQGPQRAITLRGLTPAEAMVRRLRWYAEAARAPKRRAYLLGWVNRLLKVVDEGLGAE